MSRSADRPIAHPKRFVAGALAVLALTGGSLAAAGCGGDDGNNVRDVEDDGSGSGSGSSGSGSDTGSEESEEEDE